MACPSLGEAQAPNEIEQRAARILQSKCFACHNEDSSEGGYSLHNGHTLYRPGDSEAAPIVDGSAERSELWKRVSSEDSSIRMPSEGEPLSAEEQSILRQWIDGSPAWRLAKDQRLIERASPDRLLTLDSAPPQHSTYGNRTPPFLGVFSENRKKLYVAGWGELLVWNTSDGNLEARWSGFEKRFAAIDLSTDERWLAVSSGQPGISGTVHLIDLENPKHAIRVWTASDLPPALRFSPSNRALAIGSMTGQVAIVAVDTQEIVKEELAHADQVLALEWNTDGSRWMSGSRDRTARVSEYASGELKVALGGHERSVCGVGFSSLGPITRDETGSLRLWSNDDSGRVLTKRSDLPPKLQSIAVANDRILWLNASKLMSAAPTKSVVEEPEKDDKGTPKKKTNFALQKKELQDLRPETASVHWLNRSGWIGIQTTDRRFFLHKIEASDEMSPMTLYP
ncbi:c-type cytochrome domain-containing protein [Pirellula sp. SH-Sr6A]|uniref:c-type cytochrome domain-containing protein n=1 Tax=Pirellula sp. SH-Sr6A TaxID=1632865 RepID=UPI00143C8CBB|nr:c-type cytochrome domain-containing protein [Pirellula sp. SH-Sr6A]